MRPIRVTVGPLVAASANNIVTTGTPVSGTALTLNGTLVPVAGGPAVLDTPRRVLLTFGSEAAARTMVVTGTSRGGQTQTETLIIPITTVGTVATVLDYATVTSLLPLGSGWTAAATVGTNGVAASAWVNFDEYAMPQISIQCNVTGTVNYTIQQTLDTASVDSGNTEASFVWINSPDSNVVGATSSQQSNYAYMPKWARVLLNSGSGSVKATFIQSSVAPY